jgi:hypothetical protein
MSNGKHNEAAQLFAGIGQEDGDQERKDQTQGRKSSIIGRRLAGEVRMEFAHQRDQVDASDLNTSPLSKNDEEFIARDGDSETGTQRLLDAIETLKNGVREYFSSAQSSVTNRADELLTSLTRMTSDVRGKISQRINDVSVPDGIKDLPRESAESIKKGWTDLKEKMSKWWDDKSGPDEEEFILLYTPGGLIDNLLNKKRENINKLFKFLKEKLPKLSHKDPMSQEAQDFIDNANKLAKGEIESSGANFSKAQVRWLSALAGIGGTLSGAAVRGLDNSQFFRIATMASVHLITTMPVLLFWGGLKLANSENEKWKKLGSKILTTSEWCTDFVANNHTKMSMFAGGFTIGYLGMSLVDGVTDSFMSNNAQLSEPTPDAIAVSVDAETPESIVAAAATPEPTPDQPEISDAESFTTEPVSEDGPVLIDHDEKGNPIYRDIVENDDGIRITKTIKVITITDESGNEKQVSLITEREYEIQLEGDEVELVRIEYTYDGNGQLKHEHRQVIGHDNNIQERLVYLFDENEGIKESYRLDGDNNILEISYLEKDEAGSYTVIKSYNPDNSYTLRKYDDIGTPIGGAQAFDADGNLLGSEHTFADGTVIVYDHMDDTISRGENGEFIGRANTYLDVNNNVVYRIIHSVDQVNPSQSYISRYGGDGEFVSAVSINTETGETINSSFDSDPINEEARNSILAGGVVGERPEPELQQEPEPEFESDPETEEETPVAEATLDQVESEQTEPELEPEPTPITTTLDTVTVTDIQVQYGDTVTGLVAKYYPGQDVYGGVHFDENGNRLAGNANLTNFFIDNSGVETDDPMENTVFRPSSNWTENDLTRVHNIVDELGADGHFVTLDELNQIPYTTEDGTQTTVGERMMTIMNGIKPDADNITIRNVDPDVLPEGSVVLDADGNPTSLEDYLASQTQPVETAPEVPISDTEAETPQESVSTESGEAAVAEEAYERQTEAEATVPTEQTVVDATSEEVDTVSETTESTQIPVTTMEPESSEQTSETVSGQPGQVEIIDGEKVYTVKQGDNLLNILREQYPGEAASGTARVTTADGSVEYSRQNSRFVDVFVENTKGDPSEVFINGNWTNEEVQAVNDKIENLRITTQDEHVTLEDLRLQELPENMQRPGVTNYLELIFDITRGIRPGTQLTLP